MAELATEDVTVPVPTGPWATYTDEELHAAFDLVKNQTNWKMPISKVIDEKDIDIVTEAVIYFTGCLIDVEPTKKAGRVRVRAAGYYQQIGS